jgi:hypothetical protein
MISYRLLSFFAVASEPASGSDKQKAQLLLLLQETRYFIFALHYSIFLIQRNNELFTDIITAAEASIFEISVIAKT